MSDPDLIEALREQVSAQKELIAAQVDLIKQLRQNLVEADDRNGRMRRTIEQMKGRGYVE
jgi:hypothetical protein